MHGVGMWKDDNRLVGPHMNETCEQPVDPIGDIPIDQGTVNIIQEESIGLIPDSNVVAVVFLRQGTVPFLHWP